MPLGRQVRPCLDAPPASYEQEVFARKLLVEMDEDGEGVSILDVLQLLDGLACAGLRLQIDDGAVASQAYIDRVSRAAKPGVETRLGRKVTT